MSRRHEKSRQTNLKRAGSRNNPGGKRNGPKADWPEYNRDHRSEGQGAVRRMRRMAGIARKIPGMAPGTRDGRTSATTIPILKNEKKLS